MKELALQELTWKKVRASVKQVNPKLFEVIEQLSPDDSYTFFKAAYPYGSEILQKGKLFLPTVNSDLISLKDPRVSAHIQKSIGYNSGSNPPMLVLKNTLNLLITLEDRVVDYSVSQPGNILGLWRTLDHAEHNGFSYVPVFYGA